ncbi:hypothetical protein D3C86_1854660 [compost metagenome]
MKGVSVPNTLTSSAEKLDGISGVHTGPGATLLTRIPLSASDRERERVNVTIAPLVDE